MSITRNIGMLLLAIWLILYSLASFIPALAGLGVILAISALLACASDEAAPLGKYGELCDAVNLCAQPLACVNKFCTMRCDNPLTCQQSGAGSTCVGSACYTACRDTYTCPNGLVCTMAGSVMGTCRPSL